MKIEAVYPAKDYNIYVKFEEGPLLKYDMSELVENDIDLFELKYYPEMFLSARPANEGRIIAWGDFTSISGKIVEEYGRPVEMGYVSVGPEDLVELEKYIDEPIVKKALENRYKCWIYLEGEDDFHSIAFGNGLMIDHIYTLMNILNPTDHHLFFIEWHLSWTEHRQNG